MKKRMLRFGIFLISCLLLLPLLAIGSAAASSNAVSVGSAYEQLGSNDKLVYLFLCERATEVADGSRESTVFTVDRALLSEWQTMGLKSTWTRAELGVESVPTGPVSDMFWEQFSFDDILTALLHDHPFAFYWYDKTVGASVSLSMDSYIVGNNVHKTWIEQVKFSFKVSPNYQKANYSVNAPSVDPQKTKAAAASVENALAIVAKYADASDYGKLVGYRDEICALVSYNHSAASDSYTGGYGDPWQLIYVFDGNPETNVVCEGYSKAFQYLCDLTDFSGNVVCYTASGTMAGGTGAGGHMWNVVKMEDGKSYLVDITNSDDGSVGMEGELFLAGGTGGVSSGYTFWARSTRVSYVYSQNMIDFWTPAGILTIAVRAYQPPMVLITLPDSIVYDGAPITAGDRNADILYGYGGESDLSSQFVLTHAWYADRSGTVGDLMTLPPQDAGTYWIVVTAKRGAEEYKAHEKVVISPAVPAYTVPTGLTAVFGQSLRNVSLPEGFAWKDGSLSVGNAGTNRFEAIYTPADTQNYTSVEVVIYLSVAKKDISGMIPEMEMFPIYNSRVQTIEAYLPAGIAYTVDGNQATDVGVYTLTLTGIGNFCGTVTAEWKMLPDTSKLEGLTPETVTEQDRAAIEAVQASIKSDSAKAEWADVLAKCEALLSVLDAPGETTDVTEEATDTENSTPETDAEKDGDFVKDIATLPVGCVLSVRGGEGLWLILLVACAALAIDKKRTRVDR